MIDGEEKFGGGSGGEPPGDDGAEIVSLDAFRRKRTGETEAGAGGTEAVEAASETLEPVAKHSGERDPNHCFACRLEARGIRGLTAAITKMLAFDSKKTIDRRYNPGQFNDWRESLVKEDLGDIVTRILALPDDAMQVRPTYTRALSSVFRMKLRTEMENFKRERGGE